MRRSDQKLPVWTWTDEIRWGWILTSFRVNQPRFLRTTAVSVTTTTVGKRRFPFVPRLATNVSLGMGHGTEAARRPRA
jgi:hypothetical protein